jgi:SAM-dependent methyltransferase
LQGFAATANLARAGRCIAADYNYFRVHFPASGIGLHRLATAGTIYYFTDNASFPEFAVCNGRDTRRSALGQIAMVLPKRLGTMSVPECRVCGGVEGNTVYVARERMFGIGDEFEYVRCGTCGCQQILAVPADLGKYYPADYYSYAPTPMRGFRRAVTAIRNRSYFGRWRAISPGKLVAAALPHASLAAIAKVNPSRDSRILDVGCGYGELLMELRSMGFTKLTGIDPYTAATVKHDDALVIRKISLEELRDEKFDVIMMHHVFEHMPDPLGTLRTVAELLAEGGVCVIRIPVADSWASRNYGPLWVQHDAPRHLFLHTEDSIRRAAAQAQLTISDVVYDSSEVQIWGSELYKKDISLLSVPRAVYGNPLRRLLSPTFVRYRARTRWLNRQKQGDQAAFYLRPAR